MVDMIDKEASEDKGASEAERGAGEAPARVRLPKLGEILLTIPLPGVPQLWRGDYLIGALLLGLAAAGYMMCSVTGMFFHAIAFVDVSITHTGRIIRNPKPAHVRLPGLLRGRFSGDVGAQRMGDRPQTVALRGPLLVRLAHSRHELHGGDNALGQPLRRHLDDDVRGLPGLRPGRGAGYRAWASYWRGWKRSPRYSTPSSSR